MSPWVEHRFVFVFARTFQGRNHPSRPFLVFSHKPRKMRSTIVSRMVQFSDREVSPRADSRKPSCHKQTQLAYHRLCHLPPSMYQTKLYISWWHLLDCPRKRNYMFVIIYFVVAPFETAPRNKYFEI